MLRISTLKLRTHTGVSSYTSLQSDLPSCSRSLVMFQNLIYIFPSSPSNLGIWFQNKNGFSRPTASELSGTGDVCPFKLPTLQIR